MQTDVIIAKELLISLCANYRNTNDFFRSVAEALFTVENNGNVASHVNKLQFIFKSPEQAARWLTFYAEHTDNNQPLHDLCINIHPPAQPSTFPPLYHFGEGNLAYLFKNPKKWSLLTRFHQRFLTPEVIPKLKSLSIKDLIHQIVEKLDEEQEAVFLKSFGRALSAGEKATLTQILKINQRFHLPLYHDAKDILEVMSNAKNSDESLPCVTLRSEEIGLPPGYYFTKLSEHDVRGAMIGHLLGCCQYIGGAGKSCAKHAVNSEYGATYVIFEAKIDSNKRTIVSPEFDNPIFGSWVWTDNQSFIVFDSVEFNAKSIDKLSQDQLTSFFKEYGDILISLAPTHLKTVVIGKGGNTPKYLGSVALHNLHYTNNQHYSDAKVVRVLNSRDYPYAYQKAMDNLGLSLSHVIHYQHPELEFNFRIHYDAELIKQVPDYTPIPLWVKDLLSISATDFNTDSFINDPSPALGIWVATHRTILARILIDHFINLRSSDQKLADITKILPHLKKHLTPEIGNYHSGHSSVLSKLAYSQEFPFSLIETMLDLGANPSTYDGRGRPLLHWILWRDEVTLEWLKRYKIDLHQVDADGQNCLHHLCDSTSSQRQAEKILFYMRQGVNPRIKSQPRCPPPNAFVPLEKMLSTPDTTYLINKKQFDEIPLQLTEEEINIGVKACTYSSESYRGMLEIYKERISPAAGSLGEYFSEIYDQRFAQVKNYDDLRLFIINNHRLKYSDTALNSVSDLLIRFRPFRLISLVERFFEFGVDPSAYLPSNTPYLLEIFESNPAAFQVHWLDHFPEENEALKKRLFYQALFFKRSDVTQKTMSEAESSYIEAQISLLKERINSEEDLMAETAKANLDQHTSFPLAAFLASFRRYSIDFVSHCFRILWEKHRDKLFEKLAKPSRAQFDNAAEWFDLLEGLETPLFLYQRKLPNPYCYCFEHDQLLSSKPNGHGDKYYEYLENFYHKERSIPSLISSIRAIAPFISQAHEAKKYTFLHQLTQKIGYRDGEREDYASLYLALKESNLLLEQTSKSKPRPLLPDTLSSLFECSAEQFARLKDSAILSSIFDQLIACVIETTTDLVEVINRLKLEPDYFLHHFASLNPCDRLGDLQAFDDALKPYSNEPWFEAFAMTSLKKIHMKGSLNQKFLFFSYGQKQERLRLEKNTEQRVLHVNSSTF